MYVQNRVDEIRSLLPDAKYHSVNTKDNPSDLITRGLTADQLMKSDIWWHGPHWLCQNSNWTEWKAEEGYQTPELMTIAAQEESPEPMIQWARFGSGAVAGSLGGGLGGCDLGIMGFNN